MNCVKCDAEDPTGRVNLGFWGHSYSFALCEPCARGVVLDILVDGHGNGRAITSRDLVDYNGPPLSRFGTCPGCERESLRLFDDDRTPGRRVCADCVPLEGVSLNDDSGESPSGEALEDWMRRVVTGVAGDAPYPKRITEGPMCIRCGHHLAVSASKMGYICINYPTCPDSVGFYHSA